MNRVIHFELSVDEPERAVAFYRAALGWQIQKWDGPIEYWLVTTGSDEEPGIDGALTRRPHPGSTTVNTIDVEDVDETVAKITSAGGSVVLPRMAVPGVGYMAYCADTEVNSFGLMQSDPSAP